MPRLSGECKELLARLGRPGECLGAVCSARCEGLGLTYFGSARELVETRILGGFLKNDEFGLSDRHALSLEQ